MHSDRVVLYCVPVVELGVCTVIEGDVEAAKLLESRDDEQQEDSDSDQERENEGNAKKISVSR